MDDSKLSRLREILQSSHISFLIGSGCSRPYLHTLDGIEANIRAAEKAGDEKKKNSELKRYFSGVMEPSLAILNGGKDLSKARRKNFDSTKNGYQEFFSTMNAILVDRKMNLLTKQINVFTTNIDIFMEQTLEELNLEYNDGFKGRLFPKFGIENFHKTVQQTSTHYSNIAEIPTFNIMKLHGSLNWARQEETPETITYSKLDLVKEMAIDTAKEEVFVQEYKKLQIVNPTEKKFEDTVLDLTYYELMRIYSSHLEKENSVLFVIGFSMEDEHIRQITKRVADSNPTLRVFIFCHDGENTKEKTSTHEKCNDWFKDAQYQNITILIPPNGEKYTLETVSKNIFSNIINDDIEQSNDPGKSNKESAKDEAIKAK